MGTPANGSGAGWALQTAIVGTLTGNAALTALLGGPKIWDDVPRDQGFPFVTFGQATEKDWSTSTEAGREIVFVLNVWSRGAGRNEAAGIAGAIEAALSEQVLAAAGAVLTVPGFSLVALHHEQTSYARASDGETIHAAVRFRAVMEPR